MANLVPQNKIDKHACDGESEVQGMYQGVPCGESGPPEFSARRSAPTAATAHVGRHGAHSLPTNSKVHVDGTR